MSGPPFISEAKPESTPPAKLKLSLELPVHRTPFARIRDLARAAEEAGFAGVWVPDHLVPPTEGGPAPAECWTTLSAIAASTNRIGIGTLVLILPLRNTYQAAFAARTLDELSLGRLTLGVGLGGFSYRRAAKIIGVASESIEARARDLVHSAQAMREYWAGAGARRVPIVMAGRSHWLLEAAAAAAEVWNCPFVAELEQRQGELDAAARAVGRDPAQIRRAVYCVAALGANSDECDAILQAAGDFANIFGDARQHQLVGSADQVLARLAHLRGLGVDEVSINLLGRHEQRMRQVEIFACDVLPRL